MGVVAATAVGVVQADPPVYHASVPPPTLSNVSYGTHERQVLDFWKAPSASAVKPAPLVFYIHGGSWLTGSKEIISGNYDVSAFLKAGVSVVSINYRYVSQADDLGIVPPVKAPLSDAARALQFVRSKAEEWNIDTSRIGGAGESAGACSILWMAYHDDMADAASTDPVARESTRLFCAGVRVPQTSLDPQQINAWLKQIPYGGHAFGVENWKFLEARERLLPWINEYSPYALVSREDPPVSLYYDKNLENNLHAHSPQFGFHLQKRCEEVGASCDVLYDRAPGYTQNNATRYLIRILNAPPSKDDCMAYDKHTDNDQLPAFDTGTRLVFLGDSITDMNWGRNEKEDASAGAAFSPERYDVVWNSPSKDQGGSMPLGNGSTGLNAWIEPNGDLLFYISRTDSWGGKGDLLKLGRVRVLLDPAPSTEDFLQTLRLEDGTLKARCGETELRLWVDANHSVIHAEIEGPTPTTATAAVELWREGNDSDTLLETGKGQVGWYHRNRYSQKPEELAKLQGMGEFKRQDPLLHRTFGAVIKTENGERVDGARLRSPASRNHRFDIHVLAKHPATADEWLAAMGQSIADAEATSFEVRRAAHEAWWKAFWQRSWIHAEATGEQNDDAFVVSRAYALQRYINACAGRGAYPIKFNGSIFTVGHPSNPRADSGNPDYRQWGPAYWWQNTRMPYLGMCTSGDTEMTDALYKMYCEDLLEYHKYRAEVHTGHGGLYIPETMLFYGNHRTSDYGKTPFSERADKLQESPWHKWEWVSGLELSAMMLDRYDHTLDDTFLKKTVIPFAHEVLTFFDLQYECGPDGKLVMHPSQALETWWECTNPMPEVAGLHAVTDRLLALPEKLTDPEMRACWTELKAKVPALPTREVDGVKMFAPAEAFANCRNSEVPELYSVFPFRLSAFNQDNAQLGIEALNHRGPKGYQGWRQDDIFMAYLGLTEQAREYVVDRASTKHDGSRFPAFWGPNMDWIPDQTHGGVLMKAFQSMLLQTDGEKIYLMPAWPKDWNAEFKLHAPYRTVIEGRVAGGNVTDLRVTPESRRKDVVIIE